MDFDWNDPDTLDPYLLERLYYFERYAWMSLSPDMCAVINLEGQFEDVNTHWERVTGISGEALQGSYLMEHIHFDDRERALADMQKLLTSDIGSTSFSFRFLREDQPDIKLNWNVIYSPDHDAYFCRVTDPAEGCEAESIAYRDVLTGLKNRLAMERDLPEMLDRASDTDCCLAVLFVDLDKFKAVNDTYGHKAGDTLLVRTARRMGHIVADKGTIYRLGGDEFIIALPAAPNQSFIAGIAGQVVASLRNAYRIEGTQVHIGASIGIAIYPKDGDSVEEILDAGDKAMYVVKRGGKNNFAFYDCDLGEVCTADGLDD